MDSSKFLGNVFTFWVPVVTLVISSSHISIKVERVHVPMPKVISKFNSDERYVYVNCECISLPSTLCIGLWNKWYPAGQRRLRRIDMKIDEEVEFF